MTLLPYLLSIFIMIFLPLALAIALRRRYIVPWYLFCVGMATFVVSQIYHIPLNEWLTEWGVIGAVGRDEPDFIRTALVLGFSAGISETLARVAGYWLLFRYHKAQHFEDSVMIGLGHGGIEAMIFGAVLTAASITSLLALQSTDLQTLDLTPAQLTAVSQQLESLQNNPWLALASPWERVSAMTLHVVASVLVWLSFKRRNPLYALMALLYHSLFDAAAVVASQYLSSIWLIEIMIFLTALVGLLWLWRVWPRTPRPQRALNTPRIDMALLLTAFAKEVKQQWRTRRFLIVCAVFLAFGMMSPLLAKFTPELLTSIEGAEAIAAVIPEPTTADAVTQYIQNMTQFGFILVIVLGMGLIAGEKEKGTAALILSKPLTRWSFVLSKFGAQALLFLLAIVLAAVGAFFYTEFLFDGLAPGPFLFGNFLLWLWLMVFAAVTLLSSAITKSTGAAAGLAFVLSVLLLLAGNLPRIGALMPSGLVGWAAGLGLTGEIAANGGALTMGVVLIIVCLITAVAFMEQEEL